MGKQLDEHNYVQRARNHDRLGCFWIKDSEREKEMEMLDDPSWIV